MRRTLAVLLCAATLTGAAGPSSAEPAPPAPVVSEAELVPGIPLTPYHPIQLDTPDQVLAPVFPQGRTAQRPVPGPPPAAVEARIEYVPRSEVVQDRAAVPRCSMFTGPYQWQVEHHLRLKADGRQSAADCKAIRAFQLKEHIEPANGFAGPVTWAVIRLLRAQQNPNAAKRCPVITSRIACVDLPRQIMWVQQGTKVVFGPVAIRSGRAGYPTRIGWHRVYWRHKNHWSTIYHSPMPFSQFFDGGQALHGTYGNIYRPPGSYGCVNLKWLDAQKLWNVLRNRDVVYVWGRRPGT